MQFELFGLKVGVEGIKEGKHGNFIIARIQDLLRVNLNSFCVQQINYAHKGRSNNSVIIWQSVLHYATSAASGHITRNCIRYWRKWLRLFRVSNNVDHILYDCIIDSQLCIFARIDHV